MKLDYANAFAILSRTPRVLDAWLRGQPEAWTHSNEGQDTWSPFDVVGHLVHGEKTDWVPRLKIMVEQGEQGVFEPFDRFAMLKQNVGRTLEALLDEFGKLRVISVREWRRLAPDQAALERVRGRHPELGPVTGAQLLATWVVHDLGHLRQVARTMAHQLRDEVGAWREYLSILGKG
jgi:hypothetical protein